MQTSHNEKPGLQRTGPSSLLIESFHQVARVAPMAITKSGIVEAIRAMELRFHAETGQLTRFRLTLKTKVAGTGG